MSVYTGTKRGRSMDAADALLTYARSRVHTVQWSPDPPRYEIIYVGTGPHPNSDPRSGDLVATVFVNGVGGLKLEDARS